ncbi:hypothetical protein COS69_00855 [Candidatus Kaiserbacteria bacterium CG06_land_8_20_14_3_00_49_31]|nr:MAG: hypothetical protein COS69_00855 [Candidatus Kaiserbacteria bacterium CG06_land_8_20_14_3_00_49_31]
MNQKDFANIISVIIIVVLAILVAGGGTYFWQKSSLSKEMLKQSQRAQAGSTEKISNTPAETEKAMGYIKTVYDKNGKKYLDIDYVQWLSHSDNTCWIGSELSGVPQCTPNGYLIVNQNPKIKTFEISKNAEITMQTYASEQCHVEFNEKISYEIFKSFWGNNPSCTHLKSMPYNIEAQNGIITKIIEQYIP